MMSNREALGSLQHVATARNNGEWLNTTHKTQQLYSFYKVSEGGFGQKLALELLRGEGIPCEPAPSPYVGQTAVIVFGNARVQRRAERILFSY